MNYFDQFKSVQDIEPDQNPKAGEFWMVRFGGVFMLKCLLVKKLWFGRWLVRTEDGWDRKVSGVDLRVRCD